MSSASAVKIAFFDIDGTLYCKERDLLPDSVAPALLALKAKGIMPAIATGRSYCALPEKIQALVQTVGIELFVTINGQYVHYQDKALLSRPMDREAVARLMAVVAGYGLEYGFVSDKDLVGWRDTPVVRRALENVAPYIIDEDYHLNQAVHQILLFADKGLDAAMDDDVAFAGYKFVPWRRDSFDLLPEDASKTRGIKEVLQVLGVKPEETMGFGDGLNDIEMLEFVGTAVAMQDGRQELHALADYIAEPLADDGIAKALRHFALLD